MQKKPTRIMLSAALAAIAVGLMACVETSVAEPAKTTADPMQFARGAKAWAENCNRCHNVRDPKELTDWEWDVAVTHMARIGNIPGNVARDITAFLKKSN
jgi:mono/diheme cytochrome c family protein